MPPVALAGEVHDGDDSNLQLAWIPLVWRWWPFGFTWLLTELSFYKTAASIVYITSIVSVR